LFEDGSDNRESKARGQARMCGFQRKNDLKQGVERMWRLNDHRVLVTAERTNKNLGA
jgi:hypothetical protein